MILFFWVAKLLHMQTSGCSHLKWKRIMGVKVEREDMSAQELCLRAGRVKVVEFRGGFWP